MAFEYIGLPQADSTQVDYSQPSSTQPQAAGGGMNPMQGLSIYNQFAGSGTAGSSAAGQGAASGGSSAGSSLASAGPWAALAAVIIGNEREGKRQGYRDEDDTEYAKDLIGGKVLEQDFQKRWIPKFFGDDEYGFGGDASVAADLSTLDFSNAWDSFKDDSTLGKLLF